MTFEQLVVLESVVKLGSFKAAAKKLRKSQPALSVAIRNLETEFQTVFFDRSGYRPRLTPEGEIFFERAKAVLHQFRRLSLFGEELALGTETEISIGIEGIAPAEQLIAHFQNFFERYPETNLNLTVDYMSGTTERLEKGELDFGFTPLFSPAENIHAIPICDVELFPVISAILIKQNPQFIENLSAIPQVVVRDTGTETSLSAGVLEGGRKWRVSDITMMKQIITLGLGWGALPAYATNAERATGEFIRFTAPGVEDAKVKIYMARNSHEPLGPIGKKLWQEISSIYVAKNKKS